MGCNPETLVETPVRELILSICSYSLSLRGYARVIKFHLLFIYFFNFWLPWVSVAVCRLSLVAANGSYSSLQCIGFSLQWLLLLWSTGSRHTGMGCSTWVQYLQLVGLEVVVHRLCCSSACGIFLDQGSNPCPPHWQADSSPLYHQGCPDPILRKELARELETIEEVRTIVQKNQELIILLKTSSPTTLLPKHKPMESFLCKAISVRLIIPVTKEVWVYICALKSTE